MGLATDKPQGEGEEGQADEHGAAWDGDCQGPAGNGGDAGQPEGSDEREGQADPEDGGSGEQYLQVWGSWGAVRVAGTVR